MNECSTSKSLVAGIVLEGLSTAGKTSVLREIKKQQAQTEDACRSVVILGEHYSQQRQIMNGRQVNLDLETHAQLLEERISAIEDLKSWANKLGPYKRSSRGVFYLFERFHLNHRFTYVNSTRISNIEQRLCNLSCKCMLLTVSPDKVKERLQHRSNGTLTGIELNNAASAWLKEQDRLINCAEDSIVPSIILNTDDMAWNDCAKQILQAAS